MIICTYNLVGFYLYPFHGFIKVRSKKNKISIVHTIGTKTFDKIRYKEVRIIV